MAGVIAHELRNPLAAIRSALQIVSHRLQDDPPNYTVLTEVMARVDTLDALIDDLLMFAVTPPLSPAAVDLRAVLESCSGWLRQQPGNRDLRITIAGTAPTVRADPALLATAFKHLMLNAAQAMRGVGHLRLSLSSADSVAQIVIADQGSGLTDDAEAHLFEPFFSTKASGTGLGLPTARRLLALHNGSLSVVSPPGGGTSVTVRLPLVS